MHLLGDSFERHPVQDHQNHLYDSFWIGRKYRHGLLLLDVEKTIVLVVILRWKDIDVYADRARQWD